MFQTNELSRLRAPLSVNLEVTTACNLSCTFCFNTTSAYEEMSASLSGKEQDISRKQQLAQQGIQTSIQQLRKGRIFEVLDILSATGVFEIRLFGGEFTVFKPWREVLRYAFEKGFFLSFVSNGYSIQAGDADLLAECGVRDCTISVHGPEKVHDEVTNLRGSFSRAMRAVCLLQSRGIIVTIAYTPVKAHIHRLYDFVQQMKEVYGVEYFSISRLFHDSRYENLELTDYHLLLGEIARCHDNLGVQISLADSFPRCQIPIRYWQYLAYCSQGVSFAQVDFNGNLKHCSATSNILGNVFQESMRTLWENKLHAMRNLEHLPHSCKICPIFCGGGCTVSRGVEYQFAPDQFIPWPKDEGWVQAIIKALYNRGRRLAYHFLLWRNKQKPHVIEIPQFPKLTQRYQTRTEPNGSSISMFERTGVKVLSPLAVCVLGQMNGINSLTDIHLACRESFHDCSLEEVKSIVRSLL